MGLKDFLFGKSIESLIETNEKLAEFQPEQINFSYGEEKSFDWNHYAVVNQGSFGLYSSEFSSMQTRKTLASLYATEAVIRRPVDSIMRQFLGCKFKSSDVRLADRLTRKEASFWSMIVIDLVTVGDAFIWISDGALAFARLIPTDVEIDKETGNYLYQNKMFNKDNISHIKMPNPLTNSCGLSPLYSASMQVLSDKYSHEFITGFFLRGGSMAGIIETQQENADVLKRLSVQLQQSSGSRRNMHADKVLPAKCTFKPAPQTMSDIKILEIIRNNARELSGLLGVPPVLMGDTDGQNFATAEQQMIMFWEGTILPLQKFICSGLNQCPSMTTDVEFDNEGNKWLDDFDYKLKQDALLAPILSVNERRERLGFEAVSAPIASVDGVDSQKAFDDSRMDGVPPAIKNIFMKEFKQWENIWANGVINKVDPKKIAANVDLRAEMFVKNQLMPYIMPHVKIAWEKGFKEVVGKYPSEMTPSKASDDVEQKQMKLALAEGRAMEFMLGWVAESREGMFCEYSRTLTQSLNARLIQMQDEGLSASQQASNLRLEAFPEFYAGQAQTIVNTEYASVMSRADFRFMEDLADNSTKLKKTWSAVGDDRVRDPHKDINNKAIEGESKEVVNKSFYSSFVLRYPHDEQAPVGQIVNCRCALLKEVVEW